MAARFLIVNNGLTEPRGHFVETSLAVARAARRRGFDVVMGVHARCDSRELPTDLPTIPLFRVDHWGHFVNEQQPRAIPLRGQLGPLCDVPIESVLEGRSSLKELLDARFTPPQQVGGLKAKLARLAKRGLPPLITSAGRSATRLLRALVPPVAFDWLRAFSRRRRGLPPAPWSETASSAHFDEYDPLPTDVEGLLRRALGRIPPDHNEFAHYQMFAEDLERFLTLCTVEPGDHVYLPTAHGRDAAAILALVHRVGAEHMPALHLEFRHALLSVAELEAPVCPFAAFHTRTHRAYFDACRAYPESEKVHFYTDTRELSADYAALAGFSFGVLPIPFRADLIPPSPPRASTDPLRILFLGDLREEKGFTKLPPLVRAMREERVQFVVPGSLHPEEHEPAMLAALVELESYPPERVERPHRDGFIPAEGYYRLLASADVVLCPYDARAYRSRSSGVFAEAVAAGKPTVVPAGTWMASEQGLGCGETYLDDQELLRAVRRICSDYSAYRAAAEEARDHWLARQSPENLLAELIRPTSTRATSRKVAALAVA
ncbi:MAG: glycosyltransferase [Planctomycetia bacterium]|nr:glycosyltransferase [Planctomycetia bacterium]